MASHKPLTREELHALAEDRRVVVKRDGENIEYGPLPVLSLFQLTAELCDLKARLDDIGSVPTRQAQ